MTNISPSNIFQENALVKKISTKQSEWSREFGTTAKEGRVVWIYDTFENNFEITHKFTKYLKEGCGLGYDQHFSLKYFPKNALVWKISSE